MGRDTKLFIWGLSPPGETGGEPQLGGKGAKFKYFLVWSHMQYSRNIYIYFCIMKNVVCSWKARMAIRGGESFGEGPKG